MVAVVPIRPVHSLFVSVLTLTLLLATIPVVTGVDFGFSVFCYHDPNGKLSDTDIIRIAEAVRMIPLSEENLERITAKIASKGLSPLAKHEIYEIMNNVTDVQTMKIVPLLTTMLDTQIPSWIWGVLFVRIVMLLFGVMVIHRLSGVKPQWSLRDAIKHIGLKHSSKMIYSTLAFLGPFVVYVSWLWITADFTKRTAALRTLAFSQPLVLESEVSTGLDVYCWYANGVILLWILAMDLWFLFITYCNRTKSTDVVDIITELFKSKSPQPTAPESESEQQTHTMPTAPGGVGRLTFPEYMLVKKSRDAAIK